MCAGALFCLKFPLYFPGGCFFSRLRRFFRENKDFEKRNAVFMGVQKIRKPEIEM